MRHRQVSVNLFESEDRIHTKPDMNVANMHKRSYYVLRESDSALIMRDLMRPIQRFYAPGDFWPLYAIYVTLLTATSPIH